MPGKLVWLTLMLGGGEREKRFTALCELNRKPIGGLLETAFSRRVNQLLGTSYRAPQTPKV